MSKLARIVGAVVVAAAPVLAFASPAQAATGCAVNNVGNSSSTQVTIVINPTSGNPLVIGHSASAIACDYVTAGETVQLSCTLTGGRCTAYVNGLQAASCTGLAGTSCSTTFPAAAGSTIRLEVVGGQGQVGDLAA